MLAALPDSARFVGVTDDGNSLGLTTGVRCAVRGPDGSLHFVFTRNNLQTGESCQVYYTHSTDEGLTWSALADVSRNDSLYATRPAVVVRPTGCPCCVWFEVVSLLDRPRWDYMFSELTDTGWTVPANISRTATTSDVAQQISATVDGGGRVHVAYEMLIQGEPDIYYTAQSGDTWLTPTLISQSARDDGYPSLTCDSDGDLHLCWRLRGSDTGYVMYAKYDTTWSAPVCIGADTVAVNDQCLAAGPDGRVHLVFTGYKSWGQLNRVYYRCLQGDTWTAPVMLSDGQTLGAFNSTAAVDGANNVYAAWSQLDGHGGYQVVTRTLTNAWQPIVAITGDTGIMNACPRFIEATTDTAAHLFWLRQNAWDAFMPARFNIYYLRLRAAGQDIAEEVRVIPNGDGVSAVPNPFSASVEFGFCATTEPRVVRVYSATGALVRRLAVQAGQVSVVWDGRIADGLEAPAGVYTVVVGDVAGCGSVRVVRVR